VSDIKGGREGGMGSALTLTQEKLPRSHSVLREALRAGALLRRLRCRPSSARLCGAVRGRGGGREGGREGGFRQIVSMHDK